MAEPDCDAIKCVPECVQAMGGVCLSVCRFVMNVAERNTEHEREFYVATCCLTGLSSVTFVSRCFSFLLICLTKPH